MIFASFNTRLHDVVVSLSYILVHVNFGLVEFIQPNSVVHGRFVTNGT